MTDLTEFMTQDREQWVNANSSGALAGREHLQNEQKIKDDKVKVVGRAAYDSTDLGEAGPPESQYDYEADYVGGNTFTPDEEGGIELSNSQFKPGASSVAGIDVASGKKYSDEWDDAYGDIEKGQKMLAEGKFNTKTGATYDQTDGLFNVANGMIKGGGTFDNFVDQSKGPWSMDQLGMAWHAAKTANDTMSDIDNQGRQYYNKLIENYDQFAGIVHTIPPEGYTEASLSLDKDWIDGSRKMGEFLFGEGSGEGKSDAEIAESMKFFISQTRNNLDMTMMWANRIVSEGNPELARNWLALDAQYDAMDITRESLSRFAASQVNITNLLTFGGGVLISTLGKFATGAGIKNAIKAVAYGTAYDASLSGAAGVGENLSRQNIEIVAGERTEIDPVEASFAGIINATAGVVIGGSINVATNKTVRDYAGSKAGDAVKFMAQNAQDIGLGPMPGSPTAQRGSVSIPDGVPDDLPKIADEYPDVSEEYIHAFYNETPEDEMSEDLFRTYLDAFGEGEESMVNVGPPVESGGQKVQASFKLQDILHGVKDGSKVTTVQQAIKAAINSGAITQQEVKWSGVEDFLEMLDVNELKLTRQELLDTVEMQTPKPTLVPTSTPQYMNYSLLARDSSMFDSYDEAGYITSEPSLIAHMRRDFAEKGDTFEYQSVESGEWHPMSGRDAFQSLDFHLGSVPQGDDGSKVFKTRMTNANTGEVTNFEFVDDLSEYMWERYESVGTDVSKKVKYAERMLVLPSRGEATKVMDHFPEEQLNTLGPNDTMIGHSRVEGADWNGQKGKLVLEIQADYHRTGQKGGYIDEEGNWVGSQSISDASDRAISGDGERTYENRNVTSSHDLHRMMLEAAYRNNIDPYAKNSIAQVWKHLDEGTRSELRETKPNIQPFGKDWDSLGMRLEIMDSINAGDEFIMWPTSGDQISVIEQWGGSYGDDSHSIVKRATGKRNKAMKKMGLEVEQIDMPQYATDVSESISFDAQGDLISQYANRLSERNQLLWFDESADQYVVTAYPNTDDFAAAQEAWKEAAGGYMDPSRTTSFERHSDFAYETGDLLSIGSETEILDAARFEFNPDAEKGMSTLFNVVRLTDEVKKRFMKDGMNMYSMAPVAGAAASSIKLEDKPARKRNAKGQFSSGDNE